MAYVIDETKDTAFGNKYFEKAISQDKQMSMEPVELPEITTITGADANNVYTPTIADMPALKSTFGEKVEHGAGMFLEDTAETLPKLKIFLGEFVIWQNDWLGNGKERKAGELLIDAGYQQLKEMQQRYEKEQIMLNPDEQGYFSVSGATNMIFQLGKYMTVGALNQKLATAVMFGDIAAEGAHKGVESYLEQTGDESLKGIKEQSGKEFLVNTIRAGVQVYLEKKMGGVFKQLGRIKDARKLKGGIGVRAKASAKVGIENMIGETMTESAQGFTDNYIDYLADRQDADETLRSIYGEVQGAVMFGWISGSIGFGASIACRSNAIKKINKSLEEVIPDEAERANVSKIIADNMIEDAQQASAVELANSVSLRTKHGELYDSMRREVFNHIKETGVYAGMNESEVGSYVETEARRFADEVLTEANKRGVFIDDVVKATDIVAKDGRLYLQGEYFGKEERTPRRIIKKEPTGKYEVLQDNQSSAKSLNIEQAQEGESFVRLKGEKVPVEYKIIEASDLITSNDEMGYTNENYPQYLQNRDRSRLGLRKQVEDISRNIEPERLGENVVATEGAPILTQDGFVAIGNGRATAIKLAYKNGTSNTYKEYLEKQGYDTKGFKNPVLIRQLKNTYPQETMKTLIQEANVAGTSQFSVSEQSLDDANKLSKDTINLYDTLYDIDAKENRDFVIKAFNEIVNDSEKARYLDDNGFLTNDGIKRIKNATLAYVLPNKRLLSSILESEDEILRKASKAVIEVSPKLVSFEQSIEKGDIGKDYSIMGDIRTAFELYSAAKQSGKPLKVYINNLDMFKSYTDAQIDLTNWFVDSKNSGELRNKIEKYIDSATNEGDTHQSRMFGEPMTKEQIIKSVGGKLNQNDVKGIKGKIGITKGEFNTLTKSVKLYEYADFSTLQHELAHFWFDNIAEYADSGLASAEYLAQWDVAKKWLGYTGKYNDLSVRQKIDVHEKFARGYEKYLVAGRDATGGLFKDYENWITRVYRTMSEIDLKAGAKYKPLSWQMIKFFDSMTRDRLPVPESVIKREQEAQAQKSDEELVKAEEKAEADTKEAIIKVDEVVQGNREEMGPVKGEDGKETYLTSYYKMTGEKEMADTVSSKESLERARNIVENDLNKARDILDGKRALPDGVIMNTLRLAYIEKMKQTGNSKERVRAMKKQALALRRAGQEIESQKLAYKDGFFKYADATYWIGEILKNKRDNLQAKLKKKYRERNMTVEDVIKEDIQDGVKQGQAPMEIIKRVADDLGIKLNQKEIEEKVKKDLERYIEKGYESEVSAYNAIYDFINERFEDLSITEAEALEVARQADEMLLSLEGVRSIDGNPSIEYLEKLHDMEIYANKLAPSSVWKILNNIIFPANLMASIKTPLFNVIANIPTGLLKMAERRAVIGTKDNIIPKEDIKKYLARSLEIFKRTGYNLSTMTEENPRGMLFGEKITHSEGPGAFRALGRLYEKVVYKIGLGYGDIIFKDFAFIDNVSLQASKFSGGDVSKARALFNDAIRVVPTTDRGAEIRQQAITDALIATYQNQGILANLSVKIRHEIDKYTGLGKMFMAFAMTPANVIGMGLEMTYASAIVSFSQIKNKILNGKFDALTKKQIGMLVVSGLGWALSMAITAGLDDDDYMPPYALAKQGDRALAKELNIPYNSIRLGGKWYSLDVFGPLGNILTGLLSAKRSETVLGKIKSFVSGSALQLASVPVVGSFSNLTETLSRLTKEVSSGKENVDYIAGQFVDALYSRSVPAILNDIAKMGDRYEREAETGLERIQKKIPFARNMLEKRVNLTTGKAEPRGGDIERPLLDLLAGARVKPQIQNRIGEEFIRLNKAKANVSLSPITRTGDLRTIPDKQKEEVRKKFASAYAEKVRELIETERYQSATDESKKDMINRIRKNITRELKREYSEFIKK